MRYSSKSVWRKSHVHSPRPKTAASIYQPAIWSSHRKLSTECTKVLADQTAILRFRHAVITRRGLLNPLSIEHHDLASSGFYQSTTCKAVQGLRHARPPHCQH